MGEADRNVVHGEVDVPGRRSGYVTDGNRFDAAVLGGIGSELDSLSLQQILLTPVIKDVGGRLEQQQTLPFMFCMKARATCCQATIDKNKYTEE